MANVKAFFNRSFSKQPRSLPPTPGQRRDASLDYPDASDGPLTVVESNVVDGYSLEEIIKRMNEFSMELQRQKAEIDVLKEQVRLLQAENLSLKRGQRKSSVSTFPLDADTTGYLFTFLPDFSSLASLYLTCRFLYRVFKDGQQSITYSVTSNLIGQNLPQALRLALCEDQNLVQQDVDNLPTEQLISMPRLSSDIIASLIRNAEVVRKWEDLFSWKQKDRKSRISMLTKKESFRFRRALYRIMLLSFTYGAGSLSAEEMEEKEAYYQSYDERHIKSKEFFARFSTLELMEIRKVATCLRFVALTVMMEDLSVMGSIETYDFGSLLLFTGPQVLLECYMTRKPPPLIWSYLWHGQVYEKFLLHPLDKVVLERGSSSDSFFNTILDSVHGEYDYCSLCRSDNEMSRGRWLINDTCWIDHKAHVLEHMCMVFRKLWSNPLEEGTQNFVTGKGGEDLISLLYDHRPEQFRGLQKEDWICSSCLCQLCEDGFLAWRLKVQHEAGRTFNANCWYGYQCPLQRKEKHAFKYNHLCPRQLERPVPPGFWT